MVSQQKLRVVGPVILTYHNNPLEQFFKTDCDLEISVRVNETRDRPECKQFWWLPGRYRITYWPE